MPRTMINTILSFVGMYTHNTTSNHHIQPSCPEGGGSRFLPRICTDLPDYTALHRWKVLDAHHQDFFWSHCLCLWGFTVMNIHIVIFLSPLSLLLFSVFGWGALTVMSVCRPYSIRSKNEWWIGKDLKARGCGQIEVLFWHLLGRMEENHVKSQDAGVLDDIQTKHLPNTSLERYCYTNQLVVLHFLEFWHQVVWWVGSVLQRAITISNFKVEPWWRRNVATHLRNDMS
jgi:hypothetical protein